jgi:hypothetical protein
MSAANSTCHAPTCLAVPCVVPTGTCPPMQGSGRARPRPRLEYTVTRASTPSPPPVLAAPRRADEDHVVTAPAPILSASRPLGTAHLRGRIRRRHVREKFCRDRRESRRLIACARGRAAVSFAITTSRRPEGQVRGDGGVLVMAVVRGEQIQLEVPAHLVGDVLPIVRHSPDPAAWHHVPGGAGNSIARLRGPTAPTAPSNPPRHGSSSRAVRVPVALRIRRSCRSVPCPLFPDGRTCLS